MNKSWKVIIAFVGIFTAGVVAGVLVAPRIFDDVIERRGQRGPGRPQFQFSQPLGPQVIRRISEDLQLTAEQQEKIKPIETRITEELRGLRRETQAAIERMQVEISAVLTPEQRIEFEKKMAAGRERMNKRSPEQDGRGRRGDKGGSNRTHDGPPPK